VKQVQQHSQTTSTIDVEVFNDHDRPPRRFAQGRVCGNDHCVTRLSIYNSGYLCTLHAPFVTPRMRGRRIVSLRAEDLGGIGVSVSETPNHEPWGARSRVGDQAVGQGDGG
jgi:hypothetical protein